MIWRVRCVGHNNSFKPNLLRYTKAMAEKACHGFASTTQVGLIQALDRSMQDTWHFVAMEYYALVLNRTYLVSVSSTGITGKVCRGLTATESGAGLTLYITRQLAVHGNLNDPSSYVSDHHLASRDNADFTLNCADIISVSFNPTKNGAWAPTLTTGV